MSDPSAKTITQQEFDSILDHLPTYPHTTHGSMRRARDRTLLMLMWHTGIRVGELVQLRRDDLVWCDVPVPILTVRAAIAKRGHERRIPLGQRMREQLAALKGHWPPAPYDFSTPWAFNYRTPYDHVSERHVQRLLATAARSAINRRVHPHMLRHSFGTRMMRVAPARVVQQLLGHTKLSSTQVYTHPDQNDLAAAIDAAERID